MARKPQNYAGPAKAVAKAITQDAAPQSEAKVAGAQKGAPAPEPTPQVPVITVFGPKSGRRRAGRRFGAEPVHIPVDQITPDQAVALMGDPLLAVSMPSEIADEIEALVSSD